MKGKHNRINLEYRRAYFEGIFSTRFRIDAWVMRVLREDVQTRPLYWDSKDRKAEGWHTSVFGNTVAATKTFPGVVSPEILKQIWLEREAPREDVNKPGVLLVRFGNEWGWTKPYVYPLGVLE